VKVAVVLPELDPRSGGGFRFQQALLDALQAVEANTSHTFVYYSTAGGPGDSFVQLRMGKLALLRRRAIEAIQDGQDRLLGTRPMHVSTWLERSLRKNGVDLVWFSTPYAERCDLPYIFTVWDLEYLDQPWFPEVSQRGEWQRRDYHYWRYLRRATRVIVPNESGREQVLRLFSLRPDRVLSLPHPTPKFDGIPVTGDLHPTPYLFYPAQYWPHKNHAALLAALAELNRGNGRQYHLVCVGSDKGGLEHVRVLLHDFGLEAQVRLLGFVETDELVSLYVNAHALVYLSFFGPENLPPLEAFALGCPVVCADIPGAREQVGDGALLVSPTDARQIADAVRSLEDPDLRRRLITAARKRAEELTAERYVRSVLEFLDEFEPIRQSWS
jgi:glycosyltransferase involved in cell wall biosynthesis